MSNINQLVEQIGGMSAFELSDLVKAIEEKFGVSAAMPTATGAAAASAAPAAEEKTQFKVTLKEAGSEKIKVIKALRVVVPSLSLIDAKNAVEGAPYVIGETVPKDDAQKMKTTLEEAGAKVELS